MRVSPILLLLVACASPRPVSEPVPIVDMPATTPGPLRVEQIDTARVLAVQWARGDRGNVAPVIQQEQHDTLELHFDLLGQEVQALHARIVACDADWREITAFADDSLAPTPPRVQLHTNIESSTPYRHFVVELEAGPSMSGNRVVEIGLDGAEGPLLVRRFMVSEQAVEIDASVVSSRNPDAIAFMQDLDLRVLHPALEIDEAFLNIRVAVLQNFRWDDVRTCALPQFVRGKELIYPRPAVSFPGGNEWRTIDLTDPRAGNGGVAKVVPGAARTALILEPDERRSIKQYMERIDHNGALLPRTTNGADPSVPAEFFDVTWELPMDRPLEHGQLYIYGAFTGYQCLPPSRCVWNEREHAYIAHGTVKQGIVDYAYAWLPDGANVPDLTVIEGSHARTENDYLVLVYFRDRLVGARVVNNRP